MEGASELSRLRTLRALLIQGLHDSISANWHAQYCCIDEAHDTASVQRCPLTAVTVLGTIVGGLHITGAPAALCRYRLRAGSAWALADGAVAAGQTQICMRDSSPSALCPFAWAHPLEAAYTTSSLRGWPSLCVELFSQGSDGRVEHAGYGTVRIPSAPGHHVLEIACWRVLGSAIDEVKTALFGGAVQLEEGMASPELLDADAVAVGVARHTLHTKTSGTVLVDVHVILRGAKELGLDFG